MTPLLRTFIATTILLLGATLALAQSPASESIVPSQPSGWRTVIYPIHAWLPVFGADVRLPEQPGPPGSGPVIPAAETSGTLEGAALAGFRVERRRLSVEGEFLWAGMSGSVEAPRFNLRLNTAAFKLTGGFEVAPALYVDAGVRHFSADMTASILDFPEVVWEPGIWEPVVGTTFRPEFSRTLRLFIQATLGGIGDDSHRTATATANLEWKPVAHLAVGAGYGMLYLRSDGTIHDKPVHFKQTLHGPILTIGIPF